MAVMAMAIPIYWRVVSRSLNNRRPAITPITTIEMCVLHILNRGDSYGYDITEKIARYIDVGEGTIYPVLRRLSDYDFVESYLKESSDGPPRKYYKITESGCKSTAFFHNRNT